MIKLVAKTTYTAYGIMHSTHMHGLNVVCKNIGYR